MATNLQIDNALLERAVEIGGYRTKREAVTAALEEFIQRREQLKILDLFGTVDPEDMLSEEEMRAQRRRS